MKAAALAHQRSLFERFASIAQRRLGLTDSQRAAYLDALNATDHAARLDGSLDMHAIGMSAARRAGYVGSDHP